MSAKHLGVERPPTEAEVTAAYQRAELAEEAHTAAAVLLAEAVVAVPPDDGEIRFQRLNYHRAKALAADCRDEHDDLYDAWHRAGGACRPTG